MWRHNAGRDGEITVFLSLTLTCICALMCGLLESARAAGSGWYLQMAMNSSLDSLMSCYHRDLWEDYHLLFLEYENEAGLERELRPYMDSYMEAGLSYALTDSVLKVLPPAVVTDQDGRYLEQEILDYMKLGIFNMERDPVKLTSLLKTVKEADSLGDIAKGYQMDTQKALKLEKVIDQIGESLQKQEQYLVSGKKKLKDCNGSGFISDAEKLEKELQKIPGLVSDYEKQAGELAIKLEQSELLSTLKLQDLSEDTSRLVSEEQSSWKSYTDEEGERRTTVEAVEKRSLDNLKVVQAAIEEAKDTQDYIDEWEGEDEDDELDEQELWKDVYDTVDRFVVDHSVTGSGVKDKGKMKLLEGIADMAERDLLMLVMPEDRTVSAEALDITLLPSGRALAGDDGAFENLSDRNLLETALINEYAAFHFTNFLSIADPTREDSAKSNSGEAEREFQYEQEYLLYGKNTDRANLKKNVEQLIKVREAANLIYLLGDSEKRGEADTLAALITGAAGIAPLCKLLSFFILTLWAFGESVGDVRTLLNGGKISLIKNQSEWRLTLTQLLEDGIARQKSEESGNETGFDYQGYLKLFLFLQGRVVKNFRMMDMIQKNIRAKQKNFLMEKCAYQVDLEGEAKGRYTVLKRKASKAY